MKATTVVKYCWLGIAFSLSVIVVAYFILSNDESIGGGNHPILMGFVISSLIISVLSMALYLGAQIVQAHERYWDTWESISELDDQEWLS